MKHTPGPKGTRHWTEGGLVPEGGMNGRLYRVGDRVQNIARVDLGGGECTELPTATGEIVRMLPPDSVLVRDDADGDYYMVLTRDIERIT